MSEKIDVYAIVRDRLIAQLEQGVIPWRRPWATTGTPINAVSKRPYRGINLFLLPRDYADNRWVSFKQAGDLGGKVRKGEKSSLVVFWKPIEVDDDKTGRKKTIPLLRYYNVFNVEQCEGLKLPAIEQGEPFDPIEEAERIVAEMPNAPTIRHSGDHAFYQPATDSITLPKRKSFKNASEYYSTLFHELTHSTGHKSRTDRHAEVSSFRFGCEDYSKEELVAEFGAAFLCATSNISNEGTERNSVAYLQSWIKALRNADRMTVVSAASKAQRAAEYVLGENVAQEVAA